MTQKHLKPRKKSGLGKTQNVASEAVRIMALSQRGRMSKPQTKKKRKKKRKRKQKGSEAEAISVKINFMKFS
jgi:hypothetical protein